MSSPQPTSDDVEMTEEDVRRAYRAYSEQDLSTLMSFLADDVSWPDGEQRLRGREAVVEYWREQWTRLHVVDVPAVVLDAGPGVTVVRLDQEVRTASGELLGRGAKVHVLQTLGRTIQRLDIVDLA